MRMLFVSGSYQNYQIGALSKLLTSAGVFHVQYSTVGEGELYTVSAVGTCKLQEQLAQENYMKQVNYMHN
jgi:hypothetical protein